MVFSNIYIYIICNEIYNQTWFLFGTEVGEVLFQPICLLSQSMGEVTINQRISGLLWCLLFVMNGGFLKWGKKPISYILIGIPFLYTIHFGGSPILGNLHIPHKPKTSTKWCAKQLGNILGGLTLITTGKVFWKRFFFTFFYWGGKNIGKPWDGIMEKTGA